MYILKNTLSRTCLLRTHLRTASTYEPWPEAALNAIIRLFWAVVFLTLILSPNRRSQGHVPAARRNASIASGLGFPTPATLTRLFTYSRHRTTNAVTRTYIYMRRGQGWVTWVCFNRSALDRVVYTAQKNLNSNSKSKINLSKTVQGMRCCASQNGIGWYPSFSKLNQLKQ